MGGEFNPQSKKDPELALHTSCSSGEYRDTALAQPPRAPTGDS